jgi:hypothetical protein
MVRVRKKEMPRADKRLPGMTFGIFFAEIKSRSVL